MLNVPRDVVRDRLGRPMLKRRAALLSRSNTFAPLAVLVADNESKMVALYLVAVVVSMLISWSCIISSF
jgi:hypothetical protein